MTTPPGMMEGGAPTPPSPEEGPGSPARWWSPWRRALDLVPLGWPDWRRLRSAVRGLGVRRDSFRGAGGQRLWPTALGMVAIVVVGGSLRLVGPDWDGGQHLHPDERFLTMVESALGVPGDLLGYFDTDTSPANPRNNPSYGFFV
ncbi:MAG: hypothetical protein ACE5EL_07765, partial [Anaerolineae bacterium]